MGRRIRDRDWSATPLGPLDRWPTVLRSALGICLGSSFPTAIYWGEDEILLYNDAWAPIPGERHPDCLGRPAREIWSDVWDVIGPQLAEVRDSGEGIALYDQLLHFVRAGRRTESWWNYSFTPIRGDDGEVCGVFNQGNETTRSVLAERTRSARIDRLEEIFDQAPGAVALLTGPDHVFELCNPAYLEMIGRDDHVIGLPVAVALPEVVEQGFVDVLDTVFRSGEAFRATGRPVELRRGSGATPETRMLDFVFQPIKNDNGEVTDIFVEANDVTERTAAERARLASEERLQLALGSSIGIGIWDWDIPGDVVRSDPRFAELYGVPPELAEAGVPIEQFIAGIHPDDVARVGAAIDHSIKTGAPFSEEYRLRRPDGAELWVTAQGRVIHDEQGRPARLPGVAFDITTRRLAEQAARDAASELRLATEAQAFVFRLAERLRALASPVAITRLTATAVGRRLGADRVGFHRTLPGEVEFGTCWTSERLPPLTGTMSFDGLGAETVTAYLAGETRVVADYAASGDMAGSAVGKLSGAGIGVPLRRQGKWAATLFVNQALPRRWAAEEIALVEAVAEVAWDAVDRANAALALRESEEKFRAIANSIDQMVWSTQPDGYHDYYNERWYEYTGMSPGSTDGEAWNGMFHPDDQQRAWSLWQHCLKTGVPYRIEYRLRHHSGDYRWVLGSAQPVRGEDGQITRWFGTCTDIAEIVEAREVLARSRDELEDAIVERTDQLMAAEEQLRQAQKMEAVGQLTGGIAHDFNNMLAVVIGGLDLMQRRLAQGRTDVGRYVDAARDGAERAAALTQRLLAFSRQTPLAPVPLDANAMISGMAELMRRTIGESVTIETALADDLWVATADPSQLENVILNLSVNARDAMPRGGLLTIATTNRTIAADEGARHGIGPGDYVAIAVTDTGIGMTREVADKAFDPFFTTKSVGKGTGLGLSQVFGFVRQSSGHIALDTAPGAGTTMTILLPRAHGAVPTVAIQPDVVGGRETVIVVEDDARVRSYSVEALRELGYTVVHAPDGPAALALIDAGQAADLLFTDVIMPDMTGRELAEAAVTRLPGLRVLYTSGYTGDAIEPNGAVSILSKPFDVATLARRIRAALDAGDGVA